MSTRERILTIRLLEMAEKYPAYAKALGIEAAETFIGAQAAGNAP